MEKIIMKQEYQIYIEREQKEITTAEYKKEIDKEQVKNILMHKALGVKVNVNDDYDTDYDFQEFRKYVLSRDESELMKGKYLYTQEHDTERKIVYYEEISFCE